MSPRSARGIAWSLLGVYVILGTVGLALQAIAGLFAPLRRRIQKGIGRRFYWSNAH